MDKRKILLIEDSASDRRIYMRFLEKEPYEIEEAATGEAALAILKDFHPECVILDYRLPDTDGIRLLAKIQAIRPVPVIFVTGQAEPLLMTEAYRNGVVRYLSKDFLSSQELKKAVAEAVE